MSQAPDQSTTAGGFTVGDDIFVRDPTRFLPNVTCIVGPILSIDTASDLPILMRGSVGRLGGGHPDVEVRFAFADVGHRRGTPISKLSGRPGHQGFDEFCRIAESWGYP